MVQISASYAIQLALKQQWDAAIQANKKLLEESPNDIDALKRLAYAYIQIGNIKKAKAHYNDVLKIDKHNPIALKALDRIKNITTTTPNNNVTIASTPQIFLEEAGRTKVVSLINLAPNSVLCNAAIGQKVALLPKRHSVEVRMDTTYLGALPDDIAHRLARLITGGNIYETYIKHVSKNKLTVFIREIKRGEKYKDTPSFVSSIQSTYVSFVRKSLVDDDTPDVTRLEEEEDEESN